MELDLLDDMAATGENKRYLPGVTFPENLKTTSGLSAYSQWEGGMLGVLNRQLEDFNDFHDKWYLNDLTH